MTAALLIPYIAGAGFTLVIVGIGLALLPEASTYPIPTVAIEGIVTIYHWMYTLNSILPMDTLAQVTAWVMATLFVTRFLIPIVLWIIMTFTGAGQ